MNNFKENLKQNATLEYNPKLLFTNLNNVTVTFLTSS